MVTIFNAEYTDQQDITVNWTTGIEYQCQKFILESSFNGFAFDSLSQRKATGIISTVAQKYQVIDHNLRDIIYYRLKVINDNPAIGYHLEFYTDPVVVRRDVQPDIVNSVFPNPFTDRITITFTSVINQKVVVKLFDLSGRLVKSEESIPNSVYFSLENIRRSLTPGIYILSVQVGDEKPTAYKMFTAGL
jgi:hypothetical protein